MMKKIFLYFQMPPFGPHVKGFILTFLRILIDADFPFPAEDSNAYDQIMNLRYLAVAGSVNNFRNVDIFFTPNICAFIEKKMKTMREVYMIQ